MRRPRWGILATGAIARGFAEDARRAGTDIAAVGSRSPSRAEEFAQAFGIARSYGSTAQLIADPAIDVVYIATPNRTHAEIAIACLRAGKHVLVEKPFALNEAGAAEIARAAADAGRIAQEAMWTRFLPQMARIRELVRSGALGEIRSVSAEFAQRFPDATERRMLDPSSGGGALLDLGAYPVAFAWDILGAPIGVRAISSSAGPGLLDREISVLLDHASGAHALLHAQIGAAGSNRAVVVGTEARIEIDPIWFTATAFRLIDSQGRIVETYRSTDTGRALQYEALAVERAILDGRQTTTEAPIDESVQIMGTFDRIRSSLAES